MRQAAVGMPRTVEYALCNGHQYWQEEFVRFFAERKRAGVNGGFVK